MTETERPAMIFRQAALSQQRYRYISRPSPSDRLGRQAAGATLLAASLVTALALAPVVKPEVGGVVTRANGGRLLVELAPSTPVRFLSAGQSIQLHLGGLPELQPLDLRVAGAARPCAARLCVLLIATGPSRSAIVEPRVPARLQMQAVSVAELLVRTGR
jgi:hypothetical protein